MDMVGTLYCNMVVVRVGGVDLQHLLIQSRVIIGSASTSLMVTIMLSIVSLARIPLSASEDNEFSWQTLPGSQKTDRAGSW